MQIGCKINLSEPPDPETHEALIREGAEMTRCPAEWLMPSRDTAERMAHTLQGAGVKCFVYYWCTPTENDRIEDLAAYLPLEQLGEEDWFEPDDSVIMLDGTTRSILISENLVDKINAISAGILWETFERIPGALHISSARFLPEPIQIPRVMGLTQGTTGMWFVEGDGREILSKRNLEFLQKNGIAFTSKCTAGGKILIRPTVPVFSGRVISLLRENEAMGLDGAPSYLFIEGTHGSTL